MPTAQPMTLDSFQEGQAVEFGPKWLDLGLDDYPEPGMRATIAKIERQDERNGESYARVTFDFSLFEDHNRAFESADCMVDDKMMTYRAAGWYAPVDIIWLPWSIGDNVLIHHDASPLIHEWKSGETGLSYTEWLEKELLATRAAAETGIDLSLPLYDETGFLVATELRSILKEPLEQIVAASAGLVIARLRQESDVNHLRDLENALGDARIIEPTGLPVEVETGIRMPIELEVKFKGPLAAANLALLEAVAKDSLEAFALFDEVNVSQAAPAGLRITLRTAEDAGRLFVSDVCDMLTNALHPALNGSVFIEINRLDAR